MNKTFYFQVNEKIFSKFPLFHPQIKASPNPQPNFRKNYKYQL